MRYREHHYVSLRKAKLGRKEKLAAGLVIGCDLAGFNEYYRSLGVSWGRELGDVEERHITRNADH